MDSTSSTITTAEIPDSTTTVEATLQSAQRLGIGIYVLMGIWIGFLALFAVTIRVLRARQTSLAIALPLLVLPVIITLILVFYPRFPSKQAELQEYERRQATAATFNAYYYRDIRIALVTICSVAALAGAAAYLWSTCLDTWHPEETAHSEILTSQTKA
ncbi:hypothetical protein BV898_09833 [Hypsibius exemplaris]|uniref:G-protein coupled receptors family 3 profile domain-containing protein n=1 Tax=Hypsibius exemplaris TaxID=2072580 RepID=A0A1W0WLR3_HYPEX|nr:hypothetical protein BV898_09833 [Hypsibius exemplaris]